MNRSLLGMLAAAVAVIVLAASIALVATSSGRLTASGGGCLVVGEPAMPTLSAPSDLDAVNAPLPEGYTSADLSWTDNAQDDNCIVVERGTGDDGPFDVIVVLPPDAVSYRDSAAFAGGQETAFYRVYSAHQTARSANSNLTFVQSVIVEPTPTPTPAPARGDANCDGDIDAVDALTILLYLAGLPVNIPPGCEPLG